jgi:hydroxymethylglutaryl-CoA synthase
MTVKDRIEEVRDRAPKTQDYIAKKMYIDYATYIKFRRKLKA